MEWITKYFSTNPGVQDPPRTLDELFIEKWSGRHPDLIVYGAAASAGRLYAALQASGQLVAATYRGEEDEKEAPDDYAAVEAEIRKGGGLMVHIQVGEALVEWSLYPPAPPTESDLWMHMYIGDLAVPTRRASLMEFIRWVGDLLGAKATLFPEGGIVGTDWALLRYEPSTGELKTVGLADSDD